MSKLIGYARVSTRQQSTDRQRADLLAAGVRPDDLYVDQGVSGARASRPQFDKALHALMEGDTLVITTLDRLGRSTQNMLAFADELREQGRRPPRPEPRWRRRRHSNTDGLYVVHDHGSPGTDGTRNKARTRHRLH